MTLHIPPVTSPAPDKPSEKDGVLSVPMPRLVGHGCYACGTANTGGLGMTFSRQGDRVVSRITLRDDKGVVLAEAEAQMVYVPKERLHMVSPPLGEEMEELFAAMAALDVHFPEDHRVP